MAHPHDTGYKAPFMLLERVQQLIQPLPGLLEKFQPRLYYHLVDGQRLPRAGLEQSKSAFTQAFA